MTADLGPDRPDALPGAVPREPGTGRLLRRYLAVFAVEVDGEIGVAQGEATGPLPPTLGEVRALERKAGREEGGTAALTNIIELADPPAAPEGTSP